MPPSDPSPYQYPYPPLRSQQQQRQQYHHQPLPNTSPGSTPSPSRSPYAYDNDNDTAYTPKTGEEARILVRTPSPTPSEARELETGALDWKKLSNWRFWIRKEWVWYYIILVIILVVVALITIYHKQIVFALEPATRWLQNLKLGWLVPIGILFVISFPPLFGHEIVAILCGLVWGMWIGFAIVAAGTFLGEIGNFYAFRYCCRARGEKMEKNNITYACLAKVVRDGGFKIALIARLSAIPGHFTTAVFSTCGMGIFVFSLAAILSMPKQFITVYLGVILEQSATGSTDTKSRIISDVVLGVTILITFLAMWYIYHMMNKVKPQVIYERRKARQQKLARAASNASSHSHSSPSDDNIPLTLKVQPPSLDHSSSSSHEHEGYLYAPQPHRAGRLPAPHASGDVDVELGYGYGYRADAPGAGAGGGAGGHDRMNSASTDDVSWDMSGAPMQHAGMGSEVAGLGFGGPGGPGGAGGAGAGVGGGGGGVGGGYAYGYAYAPTYQRGESSETLTGGRGASTDTLTLTPSPSPSHTPTPRGQEREFGLGLGHGHGHGHAELTGASYRTAREGMDDGERGGAGYETPRLQLQQQDLRNPFGEQAQAQADREVRRQRVGPASPPPPSYRTNPR